MIGSLIDVDDMVEEFTKLFLDIARQSIPTKTKAKYSNENYNCTGIVITNF
jgi:hypothetical protein